MSEELFIMTRPSGYGYGLSFFPGTDLDDVPLTLVEGRARELLPEDILEKLKKMQTEIEATEKLLCQLPKTTFEQKFQRVKPEARLSALNDLKRSYLKVYLKEPRKAVARQLAQKACQHYCNWLDGQLGKLKKSLPQTKHQDIGAFFKKQLGDPRYLGDSFHDLIPLDERQEVAMSVKSEVRAIYEERVPPELRKYVTYGCEKYLFALPHVEYSLEWGIPCLDFGFDLYLVVELELREVEEVDDEFYGYQCPIHFTKDILGRLYTIVQPSPDYSYWQTIPVSLVWGLLAGELIPNGAKILTSGSNITEYEVQGFEVTIPDDFANYLADIGKKGGLATLGIIEQKTASIIEHLPQLVGPQASAAESTIDNSDVKVALNALGYKKAEANEMVEAAELSPGMSTEEKLKKVFKNIGGNFP